LLIWGTMPFNWASSCYLVHLSLLHHQRVTDSVSVNEHLATVALSLAVTAFVSLPWRMQLFFH
jgi:hypothetical protein